MMTLNVMFLFFLIRALVLLLALNWASFKNTHLVHGGHVNLWFWRSSSPAVPGWLRNEQQRQLYLAEVLIQQQWWRENRSQGYEITVGGGRAYWGPEHLPDCTQRFYTDRSNVVYQIYQYIKVSINVICSETDMNDFIYCDIIVFHGFLDLTWWQIWL